ncbi:MULTISPECIES: DUF2059 domain-containing protein [unclassified Duganella]|uniref:DUF2059 domain-containing protein n=1 Tax=unclassified Duganella TaxID=2636909 RepID=UPI00102A3AEC|nr:MULTISPECIES: DUF2059 domain-containing protein [unclassified Duganella]
MNKIASPLLLCGALSLAFAAGAQTAAPSANSPFIATAPAAPLLLPGVEQLAAARRMLQAFGMPALLRHQLGRAPTTDPEVAQLLQHMSRNATDAEICDTFAPAYARYTTTQQLDQLTAAYSTPLGRRQVQALLAKAGVEGAKAQIFTPAEQAEIRASDQLPANKIFEGKRIQIAADITAATQRWRGAYHARLMRQATTQMAAFREVVSSRKQDDPEPKFNYQRTGLATLDRAIIAMSDHLISVSNAGVAMNRDLISYGAEHMLDSDRLVSAKGIAASKAALVKTDERVERYLRALDGLQGLYRQRLADIMKNTSTPDAMDKAISNDYELLLRLGENQRAQTELAGRILDFAQSRLGKVRVDQQRMVFEDDADVQLYNTLLEQRRKLLAEFADITRRPASVASSDQPTAATR